MSTVGFIGLGTMGRPMARNLIRAGHQLTFFARRGGVIQEFEQLGGRRANSPAEVARQSEFIITIVTADAAVEEVALGPGGLIEGAAPGKLYIDMSTIGPWTARHVAERLRPRGMAMLDAPVSGGPWGAQSATLAIMVGGETGDFQRAEGLLRALGDKLFHVGPLGAGQTVKLANQMMAGGIMALISEAMLLARSAGVDLHKLADVVEASSGNSAVFAARGKKFILARQFTPGFATELMHKDVALAVELGRRHGVPLPVSAVALQQFAAALAQGYGPEDFAALSKAYERLAARSLVD